MSTLIPDGVAKRLGRQFGLERFRETGVIVLPDDVRDVQLFIMPSTFKDPQGFEADRRALVDYLEHYGPRTTPHEWPMLRENLAAVPWAYPRHGV